MLTATTTVLTALAAVLGVAAVLLLVGGLTVLLRRRFAGFTLRILSGLLLLVLALLLGAIGMGTAGYQALTREEIAAHITIRPTGAQQFEATLRFPDGRSAKYALRGDEILVDAHVIKWSPLANLLGLHTHYELDRIAGRYRAIEDERKAVRTVHSLARERPIDLVALRARHAALAWLMDAQYGSATFVPADRSVELELRVSTSGLLMREVTAEPKRPQRP
ncbi:MAG: hypothetical protein ACK6C0_16055 [Betaproteobacteria bacterium]